MEGAHGSSSGTTSAALQERRRGHALAIACPAQGHIGPMMQLSVRLAREGFTVTFVNTQHNIARLRGTEAALRGRLGLDIRLAELVDDRPDGSTSGLDVVLQVGEAFLKLGPALESLIESRLLRDDPPLSLIVSDFQLTFTQDVATKFGLPRLAFWTASAGSLACSMAVKQGFRVPREATEDNPNKLIDWVPGVPALRPDEFNEFLQADDPTDFMFEAFMQPCRRVHETTWLAINTFDALEAATVDAIRSKERPDTWTLGPVLLASSFDEAGVDETYPTAALWPEEHTCIQWLDKQEDDSVLYVSFGSIATLTAKQFTELAAGLEATRQPLLWAVRPELLYGEDAIFPEGYLERMQNQGRACFVGWAPQMRVLAHRAVGGFLTHCGWNSILESLAAGVPMLGWPSFSDQGLNNRCCVDKWKIGLDFRRPERDGIISREEIEGKVRALMYGHSSQQLKASVAMWKEAAHLAVEPSGSSSRNWTELVKAILSQPSRPRQT